MPLRLPRRRYVRSSRRLPRLTSAAVLTALASAPLAVAALPAQADSPRQSEWWLSKLHVTQAWRDGEGAGITIAVLADGVDVRQPDLTGSVIAGPDFTRSGRAPAGPHYGVIGTGVASLIAGHGHGNLSASGTRPDGIRGVAANSRILSIRVTLSPGDPLWSDSNITSRLPAALAAGIRYAVAHKAAVIELPADPGIPGITGWGGATAAAGGSAAERSAIAFAIRNNVVLVAPAGDNGQAGDAPNYPAAYRGVIAVGAFGRDFVKAPFSSHRSYVALTAAGSGVEAAAPTGYQTMNSTWAASAIVAGVAALIRSHFPNLTAGQVLTAMTKGTGFRPSNGLATGSGHGTLDAMKAMTQAAIMSPPHARPASLGALPRRQPAMPQVRSQAAIIGSSLVTDGALAAGALIVLLIPIIWYGNVAKRREREAVAGTALREHRGPAPADGGMRADPLLDFFGPQHASPAGQRSAGRVPAGPRFHPRPTLAGRSTLSPAFAPSSMLAAPSAAAVPPGPPHAPTAGAGPAAMTTPGVPPTAATPTAAGGPGGPMGDAWTGRSSPDRPFTGQPGSAEQAAWTGGEAAFEPAGYRSTLRHAPVSGSPPWEPAPRPTSELPWAAARGPQAGVVRGPQPGLFGDPSPGPVGGPPAGLFGGGQYPGSPGGPQPGVTGGQYRGAARGPQPGAAGGPQPGVAGVDPAARGAGPSITGRLGPPESAWQGQPPTASSAPPSMFETAAPPQADEPQGNYRPAGGRGSDSGTHPIYIWDPGTTEPPGQA